MCIGVETWKYGQFGTEPHTTPIFIKCYLQGILHEYNVFYTKGTQIIYAKM